MLRLQRACIVVLFLGFVSRGDAFAQTSGFSYSYVIPFVTSENNTRTNLGLNGYNQISWVKGVNPIASVRVRLFDQQGQLAGSGNYSVQPNQLVQINNIISALGGSIGTGWLEIRADEPIAAWASVIFNSTNDPSIELAIDEQIGKPTPQLEGIARGTESTRLLIDSSVKTPTFQSSLVVVNLASTGGPFSIKTYDNNGLLIETKSASINAGGMYVNNDIRSGVPGTFGPIVIEPGPGTPLRLVAESIVQSANGTGAFFPAYTLPNAGFPSVAGIWQGSVTGTLFNGQIRVEIHQERQTFYGVITLVSGNFPTTQRSIEMYGLNYANQPGIVQNTNLEDTDPGKTIYSLRVALAGGGGNQQAQGFMFYQDSKGRTDLAQVTLTRSGSLF